MKLPRATMTQSGMTQSGKNGANRMQNMSEAIQSISDEAFASANEDIERHKGEGLSAIINEALDRAPSNSDFDDFLSAREAREELKTRHGTDTAGLIKTFTGYSAALAENPEMGAELIKGTYARNFLISSARHALKSAESKAAEPEPEHSWQRLDRILDRATDEYLAEDGKNKHTSDREEYEQAREAFGEVKKSNPKLTWREFFENSAFVDRELVRDPNYAYRLAAAYGLPVTPLQQEQVKAANEQNQLVDQLSRFVEGLKLPHYEELKDETGKRLVEGDYMQRFGGDLQRAIMAAHADVISDTVTRSAALEKAKRASPIKSSDGIAAPAGSGSKGADHYIAAALDRAGFE